MASHSSVAPSDLLSLRQQLRTLRQRLPIAEQRRAARAVADGLAGCSGFGAARRIAGYWACHGELDPLPLLERAWNAGKAVYLPVLADAPPQSLRFAPYSPGTPLRRNRFHIPEPDVAPADWLKPTELDLVLMPLVAFDPTGTRLGMGGGFYDRSFAFLLDPGYCGCRPWLLGLGYAFQKVAALPRQPWDVPLDAAITERAFSVFEERS
ncbi:MAG: 5-formyltetrahydrofolate cyclo-ligase [Candidatus Contendobacter sp.]|nr:5-formyltetrahydrofolate cyclo-ligase [Candidatus Contendobacter sp.]